MTDKTMGHVSLDLETLSLRADAVIASIGAVFWLEGDEPGMFRDSFSRRIYLDQPGRAMDPRTVLWWMDQEKEAQQEAFFGTTYPLDVSLKKFQNWYVGLTFDYKCDHPLVWTHDPSFDAAVLKHAINADAPPWPYRNTRCARTMAEYVPRTTYDALRERLGAVRHSALGDASMSGAQVQFVRNRMREAGIFTAAEMEC